MATKRSSAASSPNADANNQPNCKSGAWTRLQPAWKITQDLWGTSLDVRLLGQEYLSQFKKEPVEKYQERLGNSVFESEFRHTIETMAGMVFRSDPTPDELPEQIKDLFDDIDLCGNSFWKYCLDGFEKYLRDGNGYIYVDAPPLSEAAQGKVDRGQKLTLADRKGDRPFWVFYAAAQVVNYRYEQQGSISVLVQATLEETVIEADGGYGEKPVTRYRVLRPGSWELYGENPNKKGQFDVLLESGSTGLDFIPLIPLDEFTATPPMLTLGLLNVLNYNQKSDFDNICHLVCVPQQMRRYDSEESAKKAAAIQTASPGIGIVGWGEHFDARYLEVEGKGMQIAQGRYKDVEASMARIGVAMLSPADGGAAIKTATEVLDTASQRQSKLARLARNFENSIEKAMYITAQMVNSIFGPNTIDLKAMEDDAKMRLKIDYDRLTFTLDQLTFFSDLVDSGKLSLATFVRWLFQVVDMPPGTDADTELEQISNATAIVTEKPPIKKKEEPPPPEPKPEPPQK